jgi:hypothetical protein
MVHGLDLAEAVRLHAESSMRLRPKIDQPPPWKNLSPSKKPVAFGRLQSFETQPEPLQPVDHFERARDG